MEIVWDCSDFSCPPFDGERLKGNNPSVKNMKALLGFRAKGEKSWKAMKDTIFERDLFPIRHFSGSKTTI